jgi:nitroreductase
MNFDPEAINSLIKERRSIYQQQYSGTIIDDSIINQILENANWAPTHKLTEPWRFTVFKGEGRRTLAEYQSKLYKDVTSVDGTFREDKYQALLTKPMLSSHIISIGMKRDERKRIPEVEEIGAVYCAVENMYLTATAYGVGSYLSTGGITYFEGAKEFFNLGKDDRLLGFFHLGVPNINWPVGKRSPVTNKVQWVS